MAITLEEFRKSKKNRELETDRYYQDRELKKIRESSYQQKGTGNKLLDVGLGSLQAMTNIVNAGKSVYNTGKKVTKFGADFVKNPALTTRMTLNKVGKAVGGNFQRPDYLKDGFQLKDIPKLPGTAWTTAKQIGNVASQATINNINKFGTGLAHKVIDFSDWVGLLPGGSQAYYDISKGNMVDVDKNGKARIASTGIYKLEDTASDFQKKIDENMKNSFVSEHGNETLGSITQNVETQALSALGIMPWQLSTGVTVYENTYENAVRKGATQGQAEAEALSSAGLAIGTEYLSSGFKLKGTGTELDTYLGELTDKITNPYLRYGAQTIIQVGGEAIEEQVEGWSNVQMRNLIYGTNEQYTYDDFIEDGVSGALSTLASNGINPKTWVNIKQGRNLITGNTVYEQSLIDTITDATIANAEKVGIQVENRQKVKEDVTNKLREAVGKGEVSSGRDVVNALKDSTISQEEFINALNDNNNRGIVQSKIAASNYVDNSIKNNNYNQIVQGINNNLDSQNRLNSYKVEINNSLSQDENYQQMFRENSQQYEQEVEKRALKQYLAEEINNKLQEIDAEFERYDPSDKDTQAMKNYFKDIVAKKNIRFVFEDNLTNEKGQTADGYIANAADGFTEIHLNRNSDRNMVYTTIHELYHLIKGTELEKALVQYAVNNTGSEQFETAKKALLESYNKNEINEEAAADMAAILLEDSNFVNYLYGDNSVNSKSFIKAVGDYVTKLLKNFTEKGRAENAQIKALENFKNLWVKNYNTQLNNLGKDTKYEVSAEGRSELAKRLVGQGEDWTNNNIVMKNKLPKALQNFDNTNSPSVIESHVYNNIYSKEEYDNFAQIKGWAVSKDNDGKNFHATGLSDYIEAINGMDDPLAVYQYTSSDKKHKSNEFIIVTKHQANIKNNKDGSNKLTKNGSEIKGNMVVAYQITDKSDIDSLPKVKGKPVPANIIKTVFASENAIDQYQAKVDKGEMIKIFQGEGKEVPYDLRVEDMNGNLKVYDTKDNEMSKVKKDSEGNTLSQGVRKVLGTGRVSKVMFNDKGELLIFWHQQTRGGGQYESLDPVMSPINQILGRNKKVIPNEVYGILSEGNKWTFLILSKDAAKSYAVGESVDALPKIKSMKQLQETIDYMNTELGTDNLYSIEEDGGKYRLTRKLTEEENFIASLTSEERKALKTALEETPSMDYALLKLSMKPNNAALVQKIRANLKELGNNPNSIARIEDIIDNPEGFGFTENGFEIKTGVIQEYENKEELYKHFNHDITTNETYYHDDYLYGVYAFPEQVFKVDVEKDGDASVVNSPHIQAQLNAWKYVYKADESVKKTDWWKNTLQKYRKERYKIDEYAKDASEELYLSTDELASYVMLVVNPERVKNGLPPYQALMIDNVIDAGGSGGAHKTTELIVFNDTRLMKSSENKNPTNDPHMDYSISNKGTMWEQYLKTLKDNIPSSAKGKGINFVAKEHLKNKPAPVINKKSTKTDIKNNIASMTETIKTNTDLAIPTSKVMSPGEIANLTPESAKSTPNLPNYKVKTGDGKSKITKSIKKSNFLSQETKDRLVEDAQINSYQTTTNKAEIDEAIRRIDSGGAKETLDWFNKEKKFDGVDVAQGLMYLKLYEEAGDFENATRVTRKLHDITRQYGQAIQAMSMLSRMTPEGMAYHAQTELDEMFNRMVDGKSKEWIQEHRKEFDLTPEEVQSIMDLTKQAANETDDYQKRVAIAKIQKIVTDKLPSSLSNKAKSFFRIAMLFNPKTQNRNIIGNSLIAPVNWVSDLFATAIDKKLAQKSGYRTVSTFNMKDYAKGFKKGAYESYNDFKMDINTRDTEINRYEQLQGKSFSDKNPLGKALNGVERVLNLAMSGGDRIFYEGEFTNALNNLMATNNVDTPTQDMIETAQNVALQRTWNDSNAYTKFVLNFRSSLNKAGGYIHLGNEQFGIGDVLLPFAKTPANLTKAIVDYSPLGFLQALGKRKALLNNIENGTATMQQQRAFVDTLGKAFAGTLLYIAAYGLAASGAATGESDDDKDVKDFLQNSLGVSSYSIKTPWGSFTYDWAQPIAAPLAIMTNAVNSVRNGDEKTGLKIVEAWLGSLNSASSVLMDQSFLQSFNDVMTNNDGIVTGMLQEISELPARAIPTFLSQINDMIDGTKRETYYKGHILQSGWNYAKSKLPGVSQTLAPKRNTLGQEIKKYGGNNNIFNVFFNPANVNSQNMGKNAEEIYRIYEATGDKTVMPSVAPYSDTTSGHIYTPKERSEYQKITGDIINDTIDYLLNYKDDNTGYDYESLSDSEKAVILAKINSFAKQVARKELLGAEISDSYKNAYEYYQHGDLGAYYINTKSANYALNYPEKYAAVTSAMTFKNYQKHSEAITKLRANTSNDKEETIKYINNIPASDFSGGYEDIPVKVKRAMLLKTYYSSYHDYDNQIVNAVLTHVDLSTEKGKEMAIGQLKKLGFKNVKIKGGYIYYD